MKMIQIAGQTDIGLRRKDNQDTFICRQLWSAYDALLVVIDGVGGYAGGDRAAAIAKESIDLYMSSPKGDTLTMLREAVIFANNQIVQEKTKEPALSRMCCVLTAVVADTSAKKLYFAHVGDTRLYRFRDGVLEKLTSDHSLVGVREDAGELTEEEAMNHPRRNEILREAGSTPHRIDDADFLDFDIADFMPQDVLLVCSDGLSDMLSRAQLMSVLSKKTSLNAQVTELISLANKQGGHDNITLVLAKNVSPREARLNASARKQTGARAMAPVEKEEIADTPVIRPQSAGMLTKLRWPLAILVAISALLAAATWYQWEPAPVTFTEKANKQPSDKKGHMVTEQVIDSLLLRKKSANSAWMDLSKETLGRDTLILSSPLMLKDSVTIRGIGSPLVIMPGDSTENQIGLFIEKNSVVRLDNVVFAGFEVAISTEENVRIGLKRVNFKQVHVPVRGEFRQDSTLNQELNFILSPKTDNNR